MILAKAPEKYWNEPGILAKGGEVVASIGKRAWILAGKTALSVAGETLLKSLDGSGIVYEIQVYEGYCTLEDIDILAAAVQASASDVLIGIGGGKILDTIKAVGDKLSLPVVSVPTIAATCAAWSALSVIYTRQGTQTGGIVLERSPKAVLSDTAILAAAPPRYIAAGIADTLVKWYEAAPNVGKGPDSIHARAGLATSKLALDILEELSIDAYLASGCGEITDAITEVTNAIIFLAGQAGSLSSGRQQAYIAHAVNNSLTKQHETHIRLHGEKVAFGLVVQLFLEGYSQTKIDTVARLLHALGQPLTLRGLGFKDSFGDKAALIANGVSLNEEAAAALPFKVNAELLEQAILNTDLTGQRIAEQEQNASRQVQAV
ncbi:iron-containing alcohol dehydrogenase family protein [Paenibacillus sp. URB8-2]|uniref:iron-containing alcohol dehydrogenase family protein n=1 Tax=Paenibacillus sp. URB8-2 TaxID=2741301 RepID=UPI0015BF37FC|nr:iron-containing alcohol dehydrogenase family protein [Paenibacillus sp. URB8-2]BCG58657.1 glycerol dehydrogenase [Paenibacillus sp. URB8-2]